MYPLIDSGDETRPAAEIVDNRLIALTIRCSKLTSEDIGCCLVATSDHRTLWWCTSRVFLAASLTETRPDDSPPPAGDRILPGAQRYQPFAEAALGSGYHGRKKRETEACVERVAIASSRDRDVATRRSVIALAS